MSKRYLLKVAISPVQEFISEARKTRDLWAGSYLLSMVTYKALEPFINKCEIIFPDYQNSPVYKYFTSSSSSTPPGLENPTLPNHFLVIVPEAHLESLIKESRDVFQRYWKGVAEGVKERIKEKLNSAGFIDWNNWEKQVNSHWQYMWVAVPYDGNCYQQYAQDVQKLLEERKLTRTFEQWEGSEAIKCSQCARREALGPEGLRENGEFWAQLAKKFPVIIRRGDRLCAVCTVKRMIKGSDLGLPESVVPKFDSTIDIAASPFKKFIKAKVDDKDKKTFLDSANSLRKLLRSPEVDNIEDIEGDFFYIEKLDPAALCAEYGCELNESIKTKAECLRKSLKTLQEKCNAAPSRYFAVLFSDGDDIGKWMSGEPPSGSSFSKNDHINRSRTLGTLAKEIHELLKKDGGEPIYTGGDDTLAMAGVDDILYLAKEVRSKYKDLPTASAGIVIAHSSEPLQVVLNEGRDAVEWAKRLFAGKKDAFCIKVLVSTGIRITFGYHWFIRDNGGTISVIDDVVLKLARWLKNGLSPGYIYDLIHSLDYFYHYDRSTNLNFCGELFVPEAHRLFMRHWAKNSPPPAELAATISALATIATAGVNKKFDVKDNLTGLLKISDFLARESCEPK